LKEGKWEPVARGAVDARDKLRVAHQILSRAEKFDMKNWAGYEWISVSSVETMISQVRQLIEQAGTDLTLGLKGRSTASVRKSSRTVVR
jgi:hypothetical protein